MDRRHYSLTERKIRLAMGGGSAPLSIIISWTIIHFIEGNLGVEMIIAISSMCGTIVAVAAVCFWDIRSILLEHFSKRRQS